MADPLQSFLAAHESSETPHIPAQRAAVCCCGNDSCAYLKHNESALEGLERDVSKAARLGQALLSRHEAYIEDSERQRKKMASQIESLETEKLELEKDNATVIEENRNLLDQLEALNNTVSDSDAHVTSLQATLQSTQREMQKLMLLASRTARLEKQIADFEREQAAWNSAFEEKEQSERSAVRRWQEAERTLSSLQDEIERIEKEAKDEKDRHAEIVTRMERRHSVENALGSAAGRLKGAAALKDQGADAPGSNVVSHFVKDILQDNSTLQVAIVELREMLNNSNEEVENLRGQISLHQPVDDIDDTPKAPISRKDLSAEMNRANSQELHVHHHYHAPAPAAATTVPRTQALRKPKKKRYGGFGSGHFTPPSGSSTPRSSFSYGTPTLTSAILQQTAASVPQSVSGAKRWSTQSNQTYQSLATSPGPGSPHSTTNRTSSIFDRVFSDGGNESSRPTTPDSEDPSSPVLGPGYFKRGSTSWSRTHSAPMMQRQSLSLKTAPSLDTVVSVENLRKLDESAQQDAIPEEAETSGEDQDRNELASDGFVSGEPESSITSPLSDETTGPSLDEHFYKQPLRRAASHESLLSISGMDIHTLQSRPSQLLAPYAGRTITSQAVISDTNAHATRPSAMSRPTANSRSLLSGMAADQRQPSKPTLGKKIGGWMFGSWGAAPTPTTTQVSAAPGVKATKPWSPSPASATSNTGTVTPTVNTAKAPSAVLPANTGSISSTTAAKPIKAASIVSSNSDKALATSQGTPKLPSVRSPGINQMGPILGFGPEIKTPVATPVLKSLDEEALRRVLEG